MKALPDCDFRYFSNCVACNLSTKQKYTTSFQGVYLAVCIDLPYNLKFKKTIQ